MMISVVVVVVDHHQSSSIRCITRVVDIALAPFFLFHRHQRKKWATKTTNSPPYINQDALLVVFAEKDGLHTRITFSAAFLGAHKFNRCWRYIGVLDWFVADINVQKYAPVDYTGVRVYDYLKRSFIICDCSGGWFHRRWRPSHAQQEQRNRDYRCIIILSPPQGGRRNASWTTGLVQSSSTVAFERLSLFTSKGFSTRPRAAHCVWGSPMS